MWELVIEYAVTAMFIADIFLNFNTGFYSRGMLIVSRRKIALNYLKFWFWLDFIASFPYDLIIESFIDDKDGEDA
jgi:hyperpolarization activated cyclic nucleotide-gated potassium channel 2